MCRTCGIYIVHSIALPCLLILVLLVMAAMVDRVLVSTACENLLCISSLAYLLPFAFFGVHQHDGQYSLEDQVSLVC